MSERDEPLAAHSPPPTPPPPARASWRAVAAWLLIGLAAVAVLAYATAHAPRKPIGLLAVLFGTLSAWGLSWLAAEFRLPAGRGLLAALTILVLFGQAGIALESHRAFAARLQKHWGNDPAAWIYEGVRRQDGIPDEQAVLLDEAARRRQAVLDRITSFAAWCHHRLSNHVSFPIESPWPRLIWLVEALAGTMFGVWLGRKLALATAAAPAKLGQDSVDELPTSGSRTAPDNHQR